MSQLQMSAIPTCSGEWTKFFDRDNPSGNGDYETLADLRKENPGKICDKPTVIDVRLVHGVKGGDYWYLGGNTLKDSERTPTFGFACVNKYQRGYYGCKDYKVRFCCQPLPKEPQCNGYWSPYYDRDDPSATGDWEDIGSLRKTHPEVCERPTEAWAMLTNGQHYVLGYNVVTLNANGFICKNKDQHPKNPCKDYKVKFCCVFKKPSCSGEWTEYFDRDDPSGTGDWETLLDIRKNNPHVCAHPINVQGILKNGGAPYQSAYETVHLSNAGLICKNAEQSDGRCYDYKVRFCCSKCAWTQWMDADNPSGTGDWEIISNLRKAHYKFCDKPVKIEARDKLSKKAAHLTGQYITYSTPSKGFVCENKRQKGYNGYYALCLDYEVRFWCC